MWKQKQVVRAHYKQCLNFSISLTLSICSSSMGDRRWKETSGGRGGETGVWALHISSPPVWQIDGWTKRTFILFCQGLAVIQGLLSINKCCENGHSSPLHQMNTYDLQEIYSSLFQDDLLRCQDMNLTASSARHWYQKTLYIIINRRIESSQLLVQIKDTGSVDVISIIDMQ